MTKRARSKKFGVWLNEDELELVKKAASLSCDTATWLVDAAMKTLKENK